MEVFTVFQSKISVMKHTSDLPKSLLLYHPAVLKYGNESIVLICTGLSPSMSIRKAVFSLFKCYDTAALLGLFESAVFGVLKDGIRLVCDFAVCRFNARGEVLPLSITYNIYLAHLHCGKRGIMSVHGHAGTARCIHIYFFFGEVRLKDQCI